MSTKKIAVTLSFDGDLNNKINLSWKILDKEFNINYLSKNNCRPHITLYAGEIKERNIKEMKDLLKKLKLKKFQLKSPGIAVFAEKKPNLFIRWENNFTLRKYRKIIKDKLKKFIINEDTFTKDKIWIPRSSIAYKDINYEDIGKIRKKLNFLFKKQLVNINNILLIDYSKKEKIRSKINLI